MQISFVDFARLLFPALTSRCGLHLLTKPVQPRYRYELMEKRYGLFIGINDYDSSQLSFCVRDANAVADCLSGERFGFSAIRLIDKEATKHNILEWMHTILDDSPEYFIFYFAGHGVRAPFGSFIATADYTSFTPGIELHELASWAQLFHSKSTSTRCAFILDCCHAGAASLPRLQELTRDDLHRTFPPVSSGTVMLGACRGEQKAYELSDIQHGVFSWLLLRALTDGEAADDRGDVTINSVYDVVCARFPSMAQTPVFKGDISGSFIIGSGFPPNARPQSGAAEIAKACETGKALINNYEAWGPQSLDEWKEGGYLDSCQRLEPIIQWFDKQLEEHHSLSCDSNFLSLRESVLSRRQKLGHFDPDTLTRYGRAIRRLGEGAFGTVWKTVDEVGRCLAYKVYHPHDLGNKEKRSRFQHGYDAMQQLRHPRIVKVHAFTVCPLGFYMDYIDGSNLRQLGGVRDELDQARLLWEVANIVLHAHERDVIHRDIKPENIIATYDADTERWTPHLTDFDLAWFPTATQLTDQALGTLSYASPEQIRAPGSESAKKKAADIYSYGQLLYFVVKNSDPVPLDGSSNIGPLKRATERWASEEAASLICQLYADCTANEPKKRPADFYAVAKVLDSVIAALAGRGSWGDDDVARLMREIGFSIAGHETEVQGGVVRFSSLTGGTNVELSVPDVAAHTRDLKMVVKLMPLHRIIVGGSTNFGNSRSILNMRVEGAISGYHKRGVQKRSGSRGSYAVYIDVPHLTASAESVKLVTEIIRRSVEALERS